MNKLGKKLIDLVPSRGNIDIDGVRYIRSECTRNNRRFGVILSKPISTLRDDTVDWEVAAEIHSDPEYDQDTFVDLIQDFCAEHVNDDWEGVWPTISEIEFDEATCTWNAYCTFDDDEVSYVIVGFPDMSVYLFS